MSDEKASMTGPEHFRAGEYKLQQATHLDPKADKEDARLHAATVAEAQAHFTAAQAMAFATMAADNAEDDKVQGQWCALLGMEPQAVPE